MASRAKRSTRPARALCALGLASLLVACDAPDRRNSESLRAKMTSFFRVEATYEVVATGELVEFDLVYSCARSPAPGSGGAPPLGPLAVYKATQDGGAIGLKPRSWPCLSRIEPYLLPMRGNAVQEVPITAWYPDVYNMRHAFGYEGASAYTGPSAHIRILSYDITVTDRAAREAWEAEARASFERIGQLPGPFDSDPGAINTSIAEPGIRYQSMHIKPMTEEYHDVARSILAPDGERYTCSGRQTSARIMADRSEGAEADSQSKTFDEVRAGNDRAFRDAYAKPFADIPTARGEASEIAYYVDSLGPIASLPPTKVYPYVATYAPGRGGDVERVHILASETYEGFSVSYHRATGEEMHPLELSAPALPVGSEGIWIDGEQVCEVNDHHSVPDVWDWDARTIYVQHR